MVITSFIKKYPKKTPNIGIKYATWVWKTKPFTVNILNLTSQANPVATVPKYKKLAANIPSVLSRRTIGKNE